MYLTSKQHDQLRTLTMAFEIPYRSYISETVLAMFPDKSSFSSSIAQVNIPQLANGNPGLAAQITLVKNSASKLFDKLSFSKTSFDHRTVIGESDVPYISELNILVLIYQQSFSPMISLFPDFASFFSLARKYAYAGPLWEHCKEKTTLIALSVMMALGKRWSIYTSILPISIPTSLNVI